MNALNLDEFKALMKLAYNAGKREQALNEKIERDIEDGVKKSPAHKSFDSFFESLLNTLNK